VITGSSAFADDDSRICRALAFPRFKFQTAKRHRPYSLRPRVGRLPPRLRGDKAFPPHKKPRGWSTERRTSLQSCRTFVSEGAGASRRSIAAISVPRVRVSRSTSPVSFGFHAAGSTPRRASAIGRPGRPCPASSSQSGRSTARSGPEASRERGYEPRPQAPHQPVSGFPPPVRQGRCRISGTVPSRGSIFETSREDALSRARRCGSRRVILAKL
jgi:hypothetical protein